MSKNIIVVGSGAAGMTAASEAKRNCPDASVIVITEDSHIAYSPCAIPWALEGKTSWNAMVMHDSEYYKKERGIDVVIETTVTSIDWNSKKLVAGDKEYSYDVLIVATGSTVFIPPIEGKELENVFTVKTVKEGMKLQKAIEKADKVVIGGAGVIGLEVACSLVDMGKDVTVIEMMNQVIPRIADSDMAIAVQKRLENKGVKFVMNAPIQKIIGKEKVESVVAAGIEYPADIVIFATGVRANLALPKMLELDIGQLGAVAVAPTMQPYRRGRLVSDVFVAGDLVQCQSAVAPGPTMSQLGSTAVKQGLVAGKNAVGVPASFGPTVSPWVSDIDGLQIGGVGLSEGLASWYGMKTISGKATGLTKARYYPGGKKIEVKLLADLVSHRIVGAQAVSEEDVTGKINWLSSVIISKSTIESFLVDSENAYCPPTNTVRDVVLSVADDLLSKL